MTIKNFICTKNLFPEVETYLSLMFLMKIQIVSNNLYTLYSSKYPLKKDYADKMALWLQKD
jgi:hypothetical protein